MRKGRRIFFEELDYVITDTVRGSVVYFFTVWLPAPTLSFLSYADEMNGPDSIDALRGLLGSIHDYAFQKILARTEWTVNFRIASVVVGGLKLAGVGFIFSVAAVAASNAFYAARKFIKPELAVARQPKRSHILKTPIVYGSFLGTSANLRYQVACRHQRVCVELLAYIVRVDVSLQPENGQIPNMSSYLLS